jgi:hypothetical protein
MELKTWAAGGFERFKSVREFKDFWKRSNTFHAFLMLRGRGGAELAG